MALVVRSARCRGRRFWWQVEGRAAALRGDPLPCGRHPIAQHLYGAIQEYGGFERPEMMGA